MLATGALLICLAPLRTAFATTACAAMAARTQLREVSPPVGVSMRSASMQGRSRASQKTEVLAASTCEVMPRGLESRRGLQPFQKECHIETTPPWGAHQGGNRATSRRAVDRPLKEVVGVGSHVGDLPKLILPMSTKMFSPRTGNPAPPLCSDSGNINCVCRAPMHPLTPGPRGRMRRQHTQTPRNGALRA